MRRLLNLLVNPLVAALLRSPLHRFLSGNVLLIIVTGQHTGTRYTLPVQYVRRERMIYILSWPERRWWRNLRGGAVVTLRLQGRSYSAQALLLEGSFAAAARPVFAATSLDRAVRDKPPAIMVTISALQLLTTPSGS